MLTTLLLDPSWRGLEQGIARFFFGPPLIILVFWMVMRAIDMLRTESRYEQQKGWTLLVTAVVIAAAFLLITRRP